MIAHTCTNIDVIMAIVFAKYLLLPVLESGRAALGLASTRTLMPTNPTVTVTPRIPKTLQSLHDDTSTDTKKNH